MSKLSDELYTAAGMMISAAAISTIREEPVVITAKLAQLIGSMLSLEGDAEVAHSIDPRVSPPSGSTLSVAFEIVHGDGI